ncbi:MAG: hypothetical protein A2X56_14300 [Nitrospirae bacterium GWC2_57_13]|jgi:predicted Rossmann fold flavoprotein|nr:MAG: hypothetical protein A2072_01395 [Nitrospirae bacterium GWC1_57_7]OGW27182.1 MAG: hypothetical protein A2X56_14300 [Nitrospirae bacterium GWC2_57_13]
MFLGMNYDVIIIGAGASGLVCAAECGKRGRSVAVLDHAERPAAKVRISGGGRCNFTNRQMGPEHFLSQNADFCRSALSRYRPEDFLALLKGYRISFVEEEGKLFCAGGSREIVTMLVRACGEAGCDLRSGCRITSVGKDDEGFHVATDQGRFRSSSLVIATGGLSYPGLGASGFGHGIAQQFGISVTSLKPGLVPFTFSRSDRSLWGDLSGISLPAAITVKGRKYEESVLFTHRGLSGPAVLQVSLFWEPGEPVMIDLLPGRDVEHGLAEKAGRRMELRTALAAWFPKRFATRWCEVMAASKPLQQFSQKELKAISLGFHAWTVTPAGTEGYATAEVTAGGVDTKELSSKTMEAKRVPGLYFIGEVLDVTGELGGYNLHWAWASGHAAGQVA